MAGTSQGASGSVDATNASDWYTSSTQGVASANEAYCQEGKNVSLLTQVIFDTILDGCKI